jgi:hypothetical protein
MPAGSRTQPRALIGVGPGLCRLRRIRLLPGPWVNRVSIRCAAWHHALVGKGANKRVAISPSTLIRWGGLAAMVAGVAYAVQGFLAPPLVRLLVPKDAVPQNAEPNEEGITPTLQGTISENINTAFFVLLILSVMALIVAVHALQVENYGPGAVERIGLGALTVLPSIVGVALILVGYLGESTVAQNLLLLGWVVATVGLLVLAILTLIMRALPWWAGLALIAGNPLIALFLGPLLGVPWALVGYAVLRMAGRRTEQPSRVR